jgi:hypothetical protein
MIVVIGCPLQSISIFLTFNFPSIFAIVVEWIARIPVKRITDETESLTADKNIVDQYNDECKFFSILSLCDSR